MCKRWMLILGITAAICVQSTAADPHILQSAPSATDVIIISHAHSDDGSSASSLSNGRLPKSDGDKQHDENDREQPSFENTQRRVAAAAAEETQDTKEAVAGDGDGAAEDVESGTTKKNDLSKKEKKKNNKHNSGVEWEPYTKDLFICRHFAAVCSTGLLKRLRYATVGAAKMHHDAWSVGGGWLSLLAFLCLVAGVFISRRVDGDMEYDTANGKGGKGGVAKKDEYSPVEFEEDEEEVTVDAFLDESDDNDEDGFGQHELGSNMEEIPSSGGPDGASTFDKIADWWVRNLSRNRPTRKRYTAVRNSDEEQQQQRRRRPSNGYDENEMTFLPPIEEDSAVAPTTPSKVRRSKRHHDRSCSSVCQSASQNLLTYWTDTTLTFTQPLLTFKIFITALLFVELNDIMAPEQSMLATPEVVGILRALPKYKDYVPHYADWLMPGLNDASADSWIGFLRSVRAVLLCSWFAFLLLPKKHAVIGGICYGLGAVFYVYLGVIGLMYDLAHSTQGGMLFVLAAVPAVPYLESNRRANHWLRKFLYIGILVPIYLFSGISKIRYEGVVANITGFWLRQDFKPHEAHRAVLPNVFLYICDHHWATAFMSWGNIVTELVLPISVMLFTECGPLRLVFHFSEIMFHFSIFLLMGPNFTRYCLMHILALNPLGYIPYFAKRQPTATPSSPATIRGDWARIGLAIFVMLMWFRTQFKSDVAHLTGLDRHVRPNPYFPFPELSMFAQPSDTPSFGVALGMVMATFVTLAIDMVR